MQNLSHLTINRSWLGLSLAGFLALPLLSGCGGGQDYGGLQRNLGGDLSNGYNNSLGSQYRSPNGKQAVGVERGTYPMIETSFQLASIPGDPFDYEQVNVQVSLKKPDGNTLLVPAFFDGGTTWRMRYSPTAPGPFSVVNVQLNRQIAHEDKLEKKEWTVAGNPQPGFVRLDKGDHSRFVFDNGERYLPLGHNVAWKGQSTPEIPDMFAKMHTAGENWSRVWMTHWDGKNLDWAADSKSVKPGAIDLEAAKKWDAIVAGAEKSDIYFQMVLQHHGQVSSTVNPNWNDNPWNLAKGGFLRTPDEFFTSAQARALTKRKLYYILSRWGYSPNILAFELFNEVENTDAAHNNRWDDIAVWHREMAIFLRQADGNHHLLTTSAVPGVKQDSPVWDTVDYIQTHLYPSDIVTALSDTDAVKGKKLDKPQFVGEFGAPGGTDTEGVTLHEGLWAGLMSGHAGTAQYWDWENVDKHNLYPQFQAASAFVTASGLASHTSLTNANLAVETSQKADLRFGPGGGFGKALQTEFVVGATGVPAGMEKFPAYLQGQAHPEMMPKPLSFQVNYAQPGTFALTVGQVSKGGAHLKITVDGKAAERDYPSGSGDHAPAAGQETLKADVPAGAHTLVIENTGKDWAVIKQFVFSNYASALAAKARIGKDYAAVWIYHRGNMDAPSAREKELTPASGRITLTGLQAGKYQAIWWDTHNGKSLDSAELTVANAKDSASLSTPPVLRDVALYVVKAGTAPGKTKASATRGGKPAPGGASPSPAGGTTPAAAPIGAAPPK